MDTTFEVEVTTFVELVASEVEDNFDDEVEEDLTEVVVFVLAVVETFVLDVVLLLDVARAAREMVCPCTV